MKTIRLTMLSAGDKVAEIRRLYFNATRETIQADLTRALDLLKSMTTEEERERVAVFMDGLAQMRSDWGRAGKRRPRGRGGAKTTAAKRR